MVLFFLFLFGICIGSFLNVVITRMQKNESILNRSYCDNCHKALNWYELVPIASFLFLRGKCKVCKSKIPIQYPLVELVTGILFVLAGLRFSIFSFELYFNLLLFSILIVLFVYDLKTYSIPDIVVFLGIGIALLRIFLTWQGIYSHIFGGIISAEFFLFFVLFSNEKWMGWGDVELAGLVGLILGLPTVLFSLFVSFASGAICGIILIALRRKSIKSQLAFGPFLIAPVIALMLLPGIFNFLATYI